uniref:Uncharacterized protein n=1 Tax=Meloidogyne hapla TaxID=6305 RepID=A0A1I8BZP5_MELHA
MKSKIERKNEIAIKRLQLCEQYFLLMHNVEIILSECRLNIAKTRSVIRLSDVNYRISSIIMTCHSIFQCVFFELVPVVKRAKSTFVSRFEEIRCHSKRDCHSIRDCHYIRGNTVN